MGTRTDDRANVAPSARASPMVAASPRRANALPRKMIPTAIANRGMASVDMTAANATGKAVQKITSTKISHTWLASHTGPIERLTSARSPSPRRAPPAVRSHRPVPRSAPPSTA